MIRLNFIRFAKMGPSKGKGPLIAKYAPVGFKKGFGAIGLGKHTKKGNKYCKEKCAVFFFFFFFNEEKKKNEYILNSDNIVNNNVSFHKDKHDPALNSNIYIYTNYLLVRRLILL
ncbi:hypothetical protein PFNF54_01339 [Plasmodium falciparum NF54]|uniref:Mitochondrial ribosomal protein L41 n=1 Tax=Plasmodium falciparum (isolate NF54) TaxID=5843 RepID=W7K9U7_PLAFO|nr:hypothetical protein PFNF54_01339 [Plasmodium falciparum NF54]